MFNPIGQFGQKAKLIGQMLKIQKQLSGLQTEYEQEGTRVVVKGGGLITAPQIKELVTDGNERNLIETLNRALKESHEKAIKKLQEVGGGGQWFSRGQ